MLDFSKATSYLNIKREEKQNDIDILEKVVNEIDSSSNDGKIINLYDFEPALSILVKYNYLRFINSVIPKDAMIDYVNVIFRFKPLIKNKTITNFKKIKIVDDKFIDAQSFITVFKEFYKIMKMGSKIDVDDYRIISDLIVSYVIQFSKTIKNLKSKLSNEINKIDELLEIINKLQKDYDLNILEYEELVRKYSKIIRNDKLFKDDSLKELNIDLRNNVKENKNKKEPIKDEMQLKIGTRESRKKEYEKQKQKEELEQKMKKLNKDSLVWVELIFEQIESDCEEFISNPNSYLPNFTEKQSTLIKEVAYKQAKFKDMDPIIVEILKNSY